MCLLAMPILKIGVVMFSNGITLNASSYKTLFSGSAGNLCVPVKPSAVIYSQFSYVHGTAASSAEQGVPLDKVRILNTLIHQLVSMKKNVSSKQDFSAMSEQQKDELIKNYQNQIQRALDEAKQVGGYGISGVVMEAGSLFSFNV